MTAMKILIQQVESLSLHIRRLIGQLETLEQDFHIQRLLFDSAADLVYSHDLCGRLLSANPTAAALFGYEPDELLHLNVRNLIDAAFYSEMKQALWKQALSAEQNNLYEVLTMTRDGLPIWLEISSRVINADGVPIVAGIARDITRRKEQIDRLQFHAYHDPLTGLPNLMHFQTRVNQALAYAERHDRQACVMFLDLDYFKQTNDTLGHHMGDLLLKEVADRLRNSLRLEDVASRLGGDEFGVLLPIVNDASEALAVSRRITAAFAEPFVINDFTIQISASIGAALFPADGADYASLLRHADSAMYAAKKQSRNLFQRYHTGIPAVFAE